MYANRIGRIVALLLLGAVLAGCSLYYNQAPEPDLISGVWIDTPLNHAPVTVSVPVAVIVRTSIASNAPPAAPQMWLQVDAMTLDEYDHDTPITDVQQEERTDAGIVWLGRVQWIPEDQDNYRLIGHVSTGGEEKWVLVIVHAASSWEGVTPQPIQPQPTSPPPLAVTPISPTAVLLPTDTPTPTPQATINFWADATTVPAGSCTTIHWETANVQAVFFDGQGVAGVGSHQTCPCTSETHTLDVLLRDGSHDVRTLTINVTGYCVTPTPPRDTTPPPAPVPIEPGSNDPNHPQELCGTVVLRWNAVSDPSGIQGYRVNLQWHDGSQWQSSPPYFIVYGTSVDVTQWRDQHTYFPFRWAVWAIDNAGNHGAQSDWRYFECPLE